MWGARVRFTVWDPRSLLPPTPDTHNYHCSEGMTITIAISMTASVLSTTNKAASLQDKAQQELLRTPGPSCKVELCSWDGHRVP